MRTRSLSWACQMDRPAGMIRLANIAHEQRGGQVSVHWCGRLVLFYTLRSLALHAMSYCYQVHVKSCCPCTWCLPAGRFRVSIRDGKAAGAYAACHMKTLWERHMWVNVLGARRPLACHGSLVTKIMQPKWCPLFMP